MEWPTYITRYCALEAFTCETNRVKKRMHSRTIAEHVALGLVSQARPFPFHSIDRFQCRHAECGNNSLASETTLGLVLTRNNRNKYTN